MEEEAQAAEQAVKAIAEWKACEEKTCKNYTNNSNSRAKKKVCLEKKLKTHSNHIHIHTGSHKYHTIARTQRDPRELVQKAKNEVK